MNWLEQAWSDMGDWITRATELAPERDPTKWDWDLAKWDVNLGHSPIFRESILPIGELQFMTYTSALVPGLFGGTGSYLAPMRAQWLDEKLRAWSGADQSQLVNFDPRASSTYTDTAVPTSKAAANIIVGYYAGAGAVLTAPAMYYGMEWLDDQLGIPAAETDYGKKAPIIGAILAALAGIYNAATPSETKDTKTSTDTSKLLNQLTALLGGTTPRDGGPRSTAPVLPGAPAPVMDQKDALMLAGVGVLGFMALNKR